MNTINYSILQKVLHALSALLIIWLVVSGFYVALVSEAARYKQVIGNINVSLSVLLIPVFMLRLYVSFGRGSPAVIDVKNLTPWFFLFIR